MLSRAHQKPTNVDATDTFSNLMNTQQNQTSQMQHAFNLVKDTVNIDKLDATYMSLNLSKHSQRPATK